MRSSSEAAQKERALRIGIINLMPQAEIYKQELLEVFSLGQIQPVMIRLRQHGYHSSSPKEINSYQYFDEAVAGTALDGLIITGAPVEGKCFEDVSYWQELVGIIDYANDRIPAILGLCWGGLVLARLLGIEKTVFPGKRFGVFRLKNLAPNHPLMNALGEEIWSPLSSHAGYKDTTLEAAAEQGLVQLLAHAPETGYLIMQSLQRQYTIHLGHSEYRAERLAVEYSRDMKEGRVDVLKPCNYDLQQPEATWARQGKVFFSNWLRQLTKA